MTFVGRIERQRNAVSNKFYRCRWIRVYHSGIELDVQLYSNSQPAAFESFEPLQIVLLTALRYCTVATGCASTPTPDPPPHHTYRLASYIKDTSTARHQFARSSFYTQMLIGDELPQLPEVHTRSRSSYCAKIILSLTRSLTRLLAFSARKRCALSNREPSASGMLYNVCDRASITLASIYL